MTTTNLQMRWYDRPIVWVLAAVNIFIVIAAAASLGRDTRASTVATPSLPRPIIIIASPMPTPAAQVAQIGARATTRAVIVYGSADEGTAIGAVEPGRTFRILNAWGSQWLKVNMDGSGVVFMHTADILNLPDGLADLQPTAEPRVVVVSVPVETNTVSLDAAPTPAEMPAPNLRALVVLDRQQWAVMAATAAALQK